MSVSWLVSVYYYRREMEHELEERGGKDGIAFVKER